MVAYSPPRAVAMFQNALISLKCHHFMVAYSLYSCCYVGQGGFIGIAIFGDTCVQIYDTFPQKRVVKNKCSKP